MYCIMVNKTLYGSNSYYCIAIKCSRKKTTMQTNMNFPTYVFATVNSGRATKVVEELKRNSQIDIIAPVTGRYDLVLRLKPNTPQNIYQTVKEIREISDVRTTDTHTGFDGMQPTKKLESQMALGVSVLTCEHNTSENVIKQLSNIPGFIEASTVPGQFDIVALWQAKTSEEIVKTSVERVSHLDGIFKSETILAYTPVFKAYHIPILLPQTFPPFCRLPGRDIL